MKIFQCGQMLNVDKSVEKKILKIYPVKFFFCFIRKNQYILYILIKITEIVNFKNKEKL